MSKSAIFLILILLSTEVIPQENWIKLNGPEGGFISALIARGDTIIAGTSGLSGGITGDHGGIFYSTNRGLNWSKAFFRNKGLVADFDFTNDGGVVAAANTAGIIKSFDLEHWFNLHPGGQYYEFWSVGVGNNGNIYAGAGDGWLLGSTNNGSSWNNIFYFDGVVEDLMYFNGNMYLCFNKFILRKTEPAGNWDTVFTFALNENNGFSLTTDNQSTIFAPSMNYFHLSTDLGNTWEQRDTSHFLYSNHLYRCIFNNRLMGAVGVSIGFGDLWGIILSDDLGYTWRMSNNGLLPKLSALRLAASGNETYVGTLADGVYKSTDYGDNWSPINDGLTAAEVYGMSFDQAGNLYSAAQGSGISRSTDKGLSWTKLNNGFDQPYTYDIVAYDTSILVAGTDYNLFRSTNGGQNWTKLPSIGGDWFTEVCKDKQNRLYALDYATGIYRSTDAGNNWTQINTYPSIVSIAFDSSGSIYAGRRGGYIYKSTDDGLTWVEKYHFQIPNATINGICIAPNRSIFATSYKQGIIRSTDNGETWVLSHGNPGYYGKWPVASDKFGNIYTTLNSDTIIRSTDNGQTWQDITSNGIMLRVRDIIFDEEGYLYLATDESVWRSAEPTPVELIQFAASVPARDVILSWKTSTETNNKGFEIQRRTSPMPGGRQASHSPYQGEGENGSSQGEGDNWVMLGFVNGSGTTTETHSYNYTDKNLETGKYTYRLKQIDFDGTFEYSKEIEVEVNTPAEYSLSQNYPNPFNPNTTIEFSLPKEENVKLSLYSILGEELRVLVNKKMTAGVHKYTLDASALPSGVYMYRLKAGGFTDTKKLLVLK